MKTVCKQVYAKYPDFDLTDKKDFIKATVKAVCFFLTAIRLTDKTNKKFSFQLIAA